MGVKSSCLENINEEKVVYINADKELPQIEYNKDADLVIFFL